MSSASQHTCQHCDQVNIPPKEGAVIHKDECCLCFDSDESPGGLNVCLTCFTGGCTGDLQHSLKHYEVSKHPIVLNIRKHAIEPVSPSFVNGTDGSGSEMIDSSHKTPKTLEDLNASDFSTKYEYEYDAYCFSCSQQVSVSPDVNAKIAASLAEIIAQDSATKVQNTSFESEQAEHCIHTGNRESEAYKPFDQAEGLPDLSNAALKKCTECDISENLWLCLICGALGCSRKEYDGSGGNGHAVGHYEKTGHSLVLKVGTIKPEGTADIWCYKCDKPVIDDSLTEHLAAFGINISEQTQTSKTLAELQLEHNLNAQFNSVFDASGKPLKLLFGPGFTGFTNMGNTCYLSSVAQACFNTPAFIRRYWLSGMEHMQNCRSQRPGTCYLCQMAKVAHGLWSGRYSQFPSLEASNEYVASLHSSTDKGKESEMSADSGVKGTKTNMGLNLQKGIAPRAFKKLIAQHNSDFLGTQQQCAFEYFTHLNDQVHRQETALRERGENVSSQFEFYTSTRIKCSECNGVKYKKDKASSVSVPMPYVEKPDTELQRETGDEAKHEEGKSKEFKVPPQPPVSIEDCLSLWFQEVPIEGFRCSKCQVPTLAFAQTGFLTFPETLVLQMRRFGMFDKTSWVPSKLLTDVTFNDVRSISLEAFRISGPQDGEQLLPEDDKSSEGSSQIGGQAPLEMIEELAMITGMDPGVVNYALLQCDLNVERACDWLFSHPDFQLPSEPTESAEGSDAKEISPDPKPGDYGMTAFVYHKGPSTMSGHYVAYLWRGSREDSFEDLNGCGPHAAMSLGKSQEQAEACISNEAKALLGTSTDKGWVCYNDQKVSEAETEVIPIGQAYLYFLQRK